MSTAASSPTRRCMSAPEAAHAALSDPRPLFLACRDCLTRGDPRATALLPRLEQFPRYAQGWVWIGEALLSAGKAAGALVAFTRAAEGDPALLAARLGAASAHAAAGRTADAAAAMAGALRLAPQRHDLALRHAQLLRDAGQAEAARAALERAVARHPDHAEAWFSLGLLRQDFRQAMAATEAFGQACALRPDWHEAAFNLGVAWQEAGDLERALDAHARALRLRPGTLARIAQALISGRTGRLWLDLDVLRQLLLARA